ncbi:hypothetical protein J2W28_002057 [Variovorax boronicumulans]|uniref:hypothetical protein n=1 Tax=Variovorax boronicumulans TaxID=436515 RepID=UPI00278614A3|nr:hypothetical protein [Variovorax boronicumulans]MDP9990887.1 hypothetical protein [Variovorax boronicumulans]MDQ0002915.1 hypothetical protein [Variovorax boronicumulans]
MSNKILLGLQLLIALSALRQKGKVIPEGEAVQLTPERAEVLIDCGAARPATEAEIAAYEAGEPLPVGEGDADADSDADADGDDEGDDEGAGSGAGETPSTEAVPPVASPPAAPAANAPHKPATKTTRKPATKQAARKTARNKA